MRFAVLLAVLLATPAAAREVPSRAIEKIMAKGDGLSAATAFRVSSVRDEYQFAAVMGLKVSSQALVVQKKAYDVLKGTDEAGNTREIWFDISAFFPEF